MVDTIKCIRCGKINSKEAKYCSQCGYELIKEEEHEKTDTKVSKEKRRKKQKTLPQIIGAAVAFAVSFFVTQQFFSNSNSFDKVMMEVASEINESCPIMVDSHTRLDNAIALPDNVFQYNYTLVNMEKNEVDTEELKEYLTPNIINDVTTNPNLEHLRKNKVTMAYSYHDMNSVFLFKITVTPKMYE